MRLKPHWPKRNTDHKHGTSTLVLLCKTCLLSTTTWLCWLLMDSICGWCSSAMASFSVFLCLCLSTAISAHCYCYNSNKRNIQCTMYNHYSVTLLTVVFLPATPSVYHPSLPPRSAVVLHLYIAECLRCSVRAFFPFWPFVSHPDSVHRNQKPETASSSSSSSSPWNYIRKQVHMRVCVAVAVTVAGSKKLL